MAGRVILPVPWTTADREFQKPFCCQYLNELIVCWWSPLHIWLWGTYSFQVPFINSCFQFCKHFPKNIPVLPQLLWQLTTGSKYYCSTGSQSRKQKKLAVAKYQAQIQPRMAWLAEPFRTHLWWHYLHAHCQRCRTRLLAVKDSKELMLKLIWLS